MLAKKRIDELKRAQETTKRLVMSDNFAKVTSCESWVMDSFLESVAYCVKLSAGVWLDTSELSRRITEVIEGAIEDAEKCDDDCKGYR